MIKYFDTEKFNKIRQIKEKNHTNEEVMQLCQNIIEKMNHGIEFQNEWESLEKRFPEYFI